MTPHPSDRPTVLVVMRRTPAGFIPGAGVRPAYPYAAGEWKARHVEGWRNALAWARSCRRCGLDVTLREHGVYRDSAPVFRGKVRP